MGNIFSAFNSKKKKDKEADKKAETRKKMKKLDRDVFKGPLRLRDGEAGPSHFDMTLTGDAHEDVIRNHAKKVLKSFNSKKNPDDIPKTVRRNVPTRTLRPTVLDRLNDWGYDINPIHNEYQLTTPRVSPSNSDTEEAGVRQNNRIAGDIFADVISTVNDPEEFKKSKKTVKKVLRSLKGQHRGAASETLTNLSQTGHDIEPIVSYLYQDGARPYSSSSSNATTPRSSGVMSATSSRSLSPLEPSSPRSPQASGSATPRRNVSRSTSTNNSRAVSRQNSFDRNSPRRRNVEQPYQPGEFCSIQ